LAHKAGKVVRPTYRRPLTPSKYSLYPILLDAQSATGNSEASRIKVV